MDIQGKTILVSGAGGALGREIIHALVAAGCAHVLALDISPESLAAFDSPEITTLLCDLTNPKATRDCLEKTYLTHPRIDILINCAGILHSAPLVSFIGRTDEEKALSDWQSVIDTNLSSVFYLSRIIAQTMASTRSKGVIINMSSICAAGNAGQGAYTASKAGVTALTHSWAKELGGLGIRCVAIAPGFIDVASTRHAVSEAHLKDIVARVPLKKLGSVQSVFQAVRYAIENDYVTGTVLEVDGGLTL